MKSSLSQTNGYLQALEKKERKRRRTKLFLLGAAGIIAAGSAIFIPKIVNQQAVTIEQSPKFRSFYATELTDDKVRAFFTGGDNRMVIRYPGEERRDTVVSYNEYASLISRRSDWQFDVVSNSDLFSDEEGDDASVSAVNDALQVALGNSSESIPVETEAAGSSDDATNDFGFRVRGDRMIGEDLSINVLNFREGIKFEMDFGDGTRKEISRSTSFSYTEPGVYVITLRASGEGVPRRIYATYPLTIEDPNARQIEEPIAAKSLPMDNNAGTEIDPPTLDDEASLVFNGDLGDAGNQLTESIKKEVRNINPATKVNNKGEVKPAQTNTAPAEEAVSNQPFFAASKMPEFPGGDRGLSRFIQRNLRYPRVASGSQKNGKVTVRFVVDENGNTKSPHVVKGLGNPYDQEVVRMISSMPKWAPGEQNGRKVPVYKSLRISFNVDG